MAGALDGPEDAVAMQKEQLRWDQSLCRHQPFGDDGWTAQTVKKLGFEQTVRGEGGRHGEKNGRAKWENNRCASV